jgi:acyl dehydratase
VSGVPGAGAAVSRQWFEDVVVGQSIPTLTVTVDPVQMFFFSAATYNGHRIHYDHRWATEVEGLSDIVVQGPLQAALLARAVTDWMGPTGRLVRFAVQNRASAHPGERLHFSAEVTAIHDQGDDGLVDLELRGWKDGDQLLSPGTATVRLPKRPRATQ